MVHYNFLSGYSHGTHEALTSVHHSSYDGEIYNHYHSELCLLYISHLLGLHLQLALEFFRRRRIKIRGERKIYRASVHDLESEFGYFWFIYNHPHEWDRYDTANRKSDIEKGVVVRPHELRNRDVRFSESPLVRLKHLHSTGHEITTGNVFVSPFHRDDSRF